MIDLERRNRQVAKLEPRFHRALDRLQLAELDWHKISTVVGGAVPAIQGKRLVEAVGDSPHARRTIELERTLPPRRPGSEIDRGYFRDVVRVKVGQQQAIQPLTRQRAQADGIGRTGPCIHDEKVRRCEHCETGLCATFSR